MMKFLGFLVLVAIGVGVWGYSHDWFEVSKSEVNGKTSIGVTIDKEKMTADLSALNKKAHDALDAVDKKIGELRSKAAKASAEKKQAIELEIQQLEQKKGTAAQQLKELGTDGAQSSSDAAKKLEQTLIETNQALEKSDH